MLAIYIVSAVVGGFLVLLSAFGGGEHGADHDHDFGGGTGEVDLHHDLSNGHSDSAGGAGAWIPFLSLRFWTYFLGSFGLTGVLLGRVAGLGEPITAWLSAGTGFLCGLAIAWSMRLIQRAEADSSAKISDMLGTEAKVLVPIAGTEPGKIRFSLKGETIELLALSHDDVPIELGADVVIVAIDKDRARVVPRAALYGQLDPMTGL